MSGHGLPTATTSINEIKMALTFYDIFYYGSLIIAVAVGLIFFTKEEPAYRWLTILVLTTLVSECVAEYLADTTGNNNINYHFFTPVEYFIYANIFYRFFKSKQWTGFLITSVLTLGILEIVNTIYLQPLNEFNSNIQILENILLVFLSLMLFVHIRTSYMSEHLLREGVFWFNSIVLIYYTFNILIAGFQNFKVYEMKDPPTAIYDINLLLSGLLYLVYAFAIYLNAVKRKTIAIHE